ncbi:MAG: ATP-binding protein [Chthoniobacterales bacterium]
MEIRLFQKNTFDDLVRLSRQSTNFLEEHNTPKSAIFAVELTIEELVTNTIKYGYEDDEEHVIDVVVAKDDATVTVIVSDDGHEFDPLSAAAPDLESSAEDREIGGLGIHLLKNLMTDLRYERAGERNVVTAVKSFEDT